MTAKTLARRNGRSAVAAVLCTSALLFSQSLLADELHGSETGTIREFREILMKMPNQAKPQRIGVEVVDGVMVREGDIIVGNVSQLAKPVAGTISLDQEATISGVAIDGAVRRWTGSIIRYVLPANHPQRADILAGIRIVQQTTNLCMLPRTTQADFVQFQTGSGCSSSVGKVGGRQNITIGGCRVGSVVHEVFHAAGLFHEQSREDRDQFVIVNQANIQAGRANNFTRAVNNASDVGAYDYGSIMHYSALAFSANGQPTITIRRPPGTANTIIGQRNAPSARDIASINTLYPTRNNTAACVQARQ
jgi:hypothetical protein